MTEKENNTAKEQQLFYYTGIAVVIIVVLVAGWFLLKGPSQPEIIPDVTPPVITDDSPTVVEPEPAFELPESLPSEPVETESVTPEPDITEPVIEEPVLPELDQSDAVVKEKLFKLNWRAGLAALFVTEDMLRNIVVQVDNIAQGQLVKDHQVFQPLSQSFQALEQDDQTYLLNISNFDRYVPYIQLLESVPPQQVIALYHHFEPLLQQAYHEQGYPEEDFTERLHQAINVLLSTPEVSYPLSLERPSVMYTFEDISTEQLPAAQKQMLRLGPDNQKRVKVLLKQYQQQLK